MLCIGQMLQPQIREKVPVHRFRRSVPFQPLPQSLAHSLLSIGVLTSKALLDGRFCRSKFTFTRSGRGQCSWWQVKDRYNTTLKAIRYTTLPALHERYVRLSHAQSLCELRLGTRRFEPCFLEFRTGHD